MQQSTIGIDGILGPHRREDSGQRHGGAQGQGQGAVVENFGLAADQISGYASEGSRQVVEALDLRVGERDLIQNQRDLLAGVEACGKLQAFAQSEFQAVGIIAGVLLAPERKIVERCCRRQDLVPGDPVHDLAHLGGIMSSGVDPAHQTAHAGTGDVVHRNVTKSRTTRDATSPR